jgi:hypothetical protein
MNQIDLELEQLHARVGLARRATEEAYRGNVISIELYYKFLVSFAYEYAVAGYADEAMTMILGIAPSYFKNTQPRQMDEDPEYLKVAEKVAETLAYAGVLQTTPTAMA